MDFLNLTEKQLTEKHRANNLHNTQDKAKEDFFRSDRRQFMIVGFLFGGKFYCSEECLPFVKLTPKSKPRKLTAFRQQVKLVLKCFGSPCENCKRVHGDDIWSGDLIFRKLYGIPKYDAKESTKDRVRRKLDELQSL